jgi:hypothetical protein
MPNEVDMSREKCMIRKVVGESKRLEKPLPYMTYYVQLVLYSSKMKKQKLTQDFYKVTQAIIIIIDT